MRMPVTVGGLTFRNPFYVGSGPTAKSIDHLVKADRLGWAGASIKLTFDPASPGSLPGSPPPTQLSISTAKLGWHSVLARMSPPS